MHPHVGPKVPLAVELCDHAIRRIELLVWSGREDRQVPLLARDGGQKIPQGRLEEGERRNERCARGFDGGGETTTGRGGAGRNRDMRDAGYVSTRRFYTNSLLLPQALSKYRRHGGGGWSTLVGTIAQPKTLPVERVGGYLLTLHLDCDSIGGLPSLPPHQKKWFNIVTSNRERAAREPQTEHLYLDRYS